MSELKSKFFIRTLDNDHAQSLRERAYGFDDDEIKVFLLKIEFEGKTVYGCWSEGIMIENHSRLEPLGEAAQLALQRLPLAGEVFCCPIPTHPTPERSTLEKIIRRVPNNARICFVADIPKLYWLLLGMFNVEVEADPDGLSEGIINLY